MSNRAFEQRFTNLEDKIETITKMIIEARTDIRINTLILDMMSGDMSYSLQEAVREIALSKETREDIKNDQ